MANLSIKLLSIPPTSASVERIFSSIADIHTKRRNKSTNERASKLVSIRTELKNQSLKYDIIESDEEDNDSDIITIFNLFFSIKIINSVIFG